MGILRNLEKELWRYCKIRDDNWNNRPYNQISVVIPPPVDRIVVSDNSIKFEVELNSFAGRRHLAFTRNPDKYFALQITIWPFWDSRRSVIQEMTIYTLIIDKQMKRVQNVILDYPYRESFSIGRFFTNWFRREFNFRYDVFRKTYSRLVFLNTKNI